MYTAKFGGTATAPHNLKYVLSLIDDNMGAVVVSACGRSFDGDEKVTDLLNLFYVTRDEMVWRKIETKYRRLVEINGINIDIDKLLAEKKRNMCGNDRAYYLSVGEELTAKCVAAATGREYVEAADFICFDEGGRLDYRETKRRVETLANQKFVVGGFYGGKRDGGRATFERGGGDISGAIFAVWTSATLYENYTDVDGVCVANPRCVFCPKVLPQISYEQMRLLGSCGAEVLHPSAVDLPQKTALPVVVKNFWGSCGTTVYNYPCVDDVVSVTCRKTDGLYVTSVLHNLPDMGARVIADIARDVKNCVARCELSRDISKIYASQDLTVETYNAFFQA